MRAAKRSLVLLAIAAAVFTTAAGKGAGTLSGKCPPGGREIDYHECGDDDVHNGYWWREESWVPGYVTLDTWFTPAPIWSYGAAVYYAPYVMQATADYRQLDLTGYLGGVAMASPADIGREVWLRFPGDIWRGPYLVVDCARRGDIYPITMGRGEVVEVDWNTALLHSMVAGTKADYTVEQPVIYDVEVSKVPPVYLKLRGAPQEAVHFPTWWVEQAEFTDRWDGKYVFLPPHGWWIRGEILDWTEEDLRELILQRTIELMYSTYGHTIE